MISLQFDKAIHKVIPLRGVRHVKHFATRLNTRVVGAPGGPTVRCRQEYCMSTYSFPDGIAYCVPNNKQRCAVNNAHFSKWLQQTHSTNPDMHPPKHTLIINASDVRQGKKSKELSPSMLCNLMSTCADCDVKKGDRYFVDISI